MITSPISEQVERLYKSGNQELPGAGFHFRGSHPVTSISTVNPFRPEDDPSHPPRMLKSDGEFIEESTERFVSIAMIVPAAYATFSTRIVLLQARIFAHDDDCATG